MAAAPACYHFFDWRNPESKQGKAAPAGRPFARARMKRLIVNGDDFGYTRGVNCGVLRSFEQGILTSTTLMANGEAFGDAVERAQAHPRLGVGCHLVLVGGRAIAPFEKIPSLADSEGRLPKSLGGFWVRLSAGRVRAADLERELRAQVERVCSAGIRPTHLDTHKHTHLHPRVMEAVARVAEEFGIRCVRKPFERPGNFFRFPSAGRKRAAQLKQSAAATAARAGARGFGRLFRAHRLRTTDRFYGFGLTGLLHARAIVAMLADLPEGTSELMCHPGVCDAALDRAPTRLKRERELEMAALIDPAVRRAIDRAGIRLISYRELAEDHE
jgi:hopanoid biosynthesis associated protein HpnK